MSPRIVPGPISVYPPSSREAERMPDLFADSRRAVRARETDEPIGDPYRAQYAPERNGRAPSRTGPSPEGTFHRWWERSLDAAGVRYRNPHFARHTFATRWLRAGAPILTLSKAMGHASIATTVDLYGHLDLADVARDLAPVEKSVRTEVRNHAE